MQSKSLAKRMPVPVGISLEKMRSHWWIITTFANDAVPVCYIMTLDEVKARAKCNRTGAEACWLQPPEYDVPEFREAWDRFGNPRQ